MPDTTTHDNVTNPHVRAISRDNAAPITYSLSSDAVSILRILKREFDLSKKTASNANLGKTLLILTSLETSIKIAVREEVCSGKP